MAVSYTTFIGITEFSTLLEADFNAFKTLADAEMLRHDWGDLYDSAFIALMGHKLTLKIEGTERSPDNIKQFERSDDGYKVAYSDRDLGSTKYGMEYKRLLDLISAQSPAGTLNRVEFHAASRPLIQPNPARPIVF